MLTEPDAYSRLCVRLNIHSVCKIFFNIQISPKTTRKLFLPNLRMGENSFRVDESYKTFCVLYECSNASAIDCTHVHTSALSFVV